MKHVKAAQKKAAEAAKAAKEKANEIPKIYSIKRKI